MRFLQDEAEDVPVKHKKLSVRRHTIYKCDLGMIFLQLMNQREGVASQSGTIGAVNVLRVMRSSTETHSES
jgi:hypothetical protein